MRVFPRFRFRSLVFALILGGLPTTGAAADPTPPLPSGPTSRAPLPPPGLLPNCLRLIEQGRYREARTLLEPVVRDHPKWARARFYLALTYHKEHRYAAARDLFDEALELDPQYHTIRYYYGWCLYYLGELAPSRGMFEAFLKTRPGYADAIFALGLIDFDEDRTDDARTRFTEVIRIAERYEDRPTESKARARLADVHVRTGEIEKAREELQRAVVLNPDNYETYHKLSRVLDRLGDAEGAEKARERHREVRERIRPSEGVPREEDP